MSIYDRDFTGICPRTIATEASPVAIENMIRAMKDEIALLKREKSVARTMLIGLKAQETNAWTLDALSECIEALR